MTDPIDTAAARHREQAVQEAVAERDEWIAALEAENARLRKVLAFVENEAKRSNEVLRRNKGVVGGQARITIATALHRVENWETYAALKEIDNG